MCVCQVIHCGGWGSGSVVKIISNMLAALHLVGVGEAFMLGKKAGIELPALFDALKVRPKPPHAEAAVWRMPHTARRTPHAAHRDDAQERRPSATHRNAA